MRRFKLVDLYCKAGGASMGYHQAGFEVHGVDIEPQKNYPFTFFQADALEFLAEHWHEYDAIAASPPCQAHTTLRHLHDREYPDLIPATRAALIATGLPYVMENVPGSPLQANLMLCGTMFRLGTGTAELHRHRYFECPWWSALVPPCEHGWSRINLVRPKVITVVGHTPVSPRSKSRTISVHGTHPRDPAEAKRRRKARVITVTGNTPQQNVVRNVVRETYSTDEAREAMGIEWMTMRELSQAIPPAYTKFIGERLLELLNDRS